jgi:hypothetical protein
MFPVREGYYVYPSFKTNQTNMRIAAGGISVQKVDGLSDIADLSCPPSSPVNL